MSKTYCVYIMTNRSRTLYTGVTNDLQRRVHEHKRHLVEGFTSKYKIDQLAFYEETIDIKAAIAREKQIKGWSRKKKIDLIMSFNPEWQDLSVEWFMDDEFVAQMLKRIEQGQDIEKIIGDFSLRSE
jgi:putative endonuclease